MKLKNWILIPLFILTGAGMIYLFSNSTGKKEQLTEDEYRNAFRRHYKIFAAQIPSQLDFAGEKVPLNRFDVREGLDRELLVNSYWHSNTQLMFKRAFRYFPIIDSVLKANNIPVDFRYLAMIESGLQNVVSPTGASGFWQIMKGTGIDYGLEITLQVDERYHLIKSTEAACKYLQEAKERFGSWTLAAVAYNMGNGATTKQLYEQQVNNYYDMYLNPETARYIFRILAVKTIYEKPTQYGFYFRKKDFYPPLITNTVKTSETDINLVEFSKIHGIPYKILKLLNPWLRSDRLLNPSGKTYRITVPQENGLLYSTIMDPFEDDQLIFNDTLLIKQIY